ncbi:Apolipoprotein A-V, partial [Camelus dromedarius]
YIMASVAAFLTRALPSSQVVSNPDSVWSAINHPGTERLLGTTSAEQRGQKQGGADPAAEAGLGAHELEEVRERLEPYMAEVHKRVGWNLEGFAAAAAAYTSELMERGVDEARGLLQEVQNRVAHHTSRVKALFPPVRRAPGQAIGATSPPSPAIDQETEQVQQQLAPPYARSQRLRPRVPPSGPRQGPE